MKFYEIKSWAVGYTKYPWVGSWGPLPEMPFFERFPPVIQGRYKRSWEVNSSSPGLWIDPGGKVWSDVLGCGGNYPSFFVSENIINDLAEESISILCATEMPISKNLSKALENVPAPKYYLLEAVPGIAYAYDLMGYELDSDSKPVTVKGVKYKDPIFRLSTWNGQDLFGKRAVHDSTTSPLCTERVKELAERKGWTNIQFNPIEVL